MKSAVACVALLFVGGGLLVLGGGCSSSDSSSPGGADAGPSSSSPSSPAGDDGTGKTSATAQAPELKIATADCVWEQRCAPNTFSQRYGGAADCTTRIAAQYAAYVKAPSTANVDAQATECAATYANRDCNFFAYEPKCRLKGTLANGTACTQSSQCVSGSCYSTSATACGVCADRAAANGDCASAACGDGLYCGKDKKCAAETAENGSCNAATSHCAAGLTCGPAGVCAKPAPLGGSCAAADCGSDLECQDGTCVATTTKLVKLGDPCTFGDDDGNVTLCLNGSCTGTDSVGQNGRCTAWPVEGAKCDAIDVLCGSGLQCVDGACKISGAAHVCN